MDLSRICLRWIVILVLSSEALTQHCYKRCNCLKKALTLNKCTQNITFLNIELHAEEILFSCKKSISTDSEDIPSFDAKYLKVLDDQSPLTLALMANRCYKSKVKGVKYGLDLNKLHNISATKNILSENNSIAYLKIENKLHNNRMVNLTFLQPDFLTHGSQLNTLVINSLRILSLKRHFDNSSHIEVLDLASNQIEVIEDSVFNNLKMLRQLNLRDNKITSLNQRTLEGLKNVHFLDLSLNEIVHLGKGAFHNLESLTFLNFSTNKLNMIDEDAFSSFSRLEHLDLSLNPNLLLQEKLFSSLMSLKALNLSECGLIRIPTNFFHTSRNIEVLNISRNIITNLENDVFLNMTKLRIVDLSFNRLESLPKPLLYPLKHLQKIFLNSNRLTTINCEMFWRLHALNTIDLSDNLIDKFTNPMRFKATKILLRNNKVDQFPAFLIHVVGLQYLDLSYNNISSIELMKALIPETSDMVIDVSHNEVDQFNIVNLENDNGRGLTKHWKIMLDLSGNFLKCNCLHYKIYKEPQSRVETAVLQLTSKENICYTKYPHYNCPLININNCPQVCNCYYTRVRNNIVVDCSLRNLTRFPEILSMKTDRYEHNQTFVYLNGNKLNIDGQKFLESYSNVTRLNLSDNRIEELRWLPPKLRELYLESNNLKTLSQNVVNNLTNNVYLQKLSLRENPWDCDCDDIHLQKYLQSNAFNTINTSDIICKNSGELLVYTKLCEHTNVLKVALPLSLTVLLAIVSALLALYFKYNTSIKVYLYSKNLCLWCVAEEEIDKEKTYDIFISYSHKDEEFVQRELLPELESAEKPFKICIHYRDWLPGEFISTQIVKSVLDSRRTLVILSNNFMESVWGKMEFRTAHLQAINEGRARVIVVLYGDLDENILDDEMKTYLRTNTYVKWGDPWFWNKLKYALPHSKLKSRSVSQESEEYLNLK